MSDSNDYPVEKVFEAFSVLPDPRTGNRKVHMLFDTIVIAILAFVGRRSLDRGGSMRGGARRVAAHLSGLQGNCT